MMAEVISCDAHTSLISHTKHTSVISCDAQSPSLRHLSILLN